MVKRKTLAPCVFVPFRLREQVPTGAVVYDVSSYADHPYCTLSPYWPHGGIPVPGMPGTTSDSVEGVWQVGSYMNMSPVLRFQGRVQCDRPGPSEPYGAVFVDPQNPVDMAIDWIRTGQLFPPPPGSTPGASEPRARPV